VKTHALMAPGAAIVATVLALPASAGRPLATEDAGVLEAMACELEPSVTRVKSAGVAERSSVVQVACGTPWRSQFSASMQRVSAEGESRTDFGLGGKTGLFGGEGAPVSLTLAYGVNLAKSASGGSRRVSDGFVNLVASGEVAKGIITHANVGTLRVREPRSNATTWNLAGEWAVGGGFDLVAEVYGNNRSERWAGAGARYTSGNWSVNSAVARMTSEPKASLVTVGAKLNF
jgi:hypothetical protein